MYTQLYILVYTHVYTHVYTAVRACVYSMYSDPRVYPLYSHVYRSYSGSTAVYTGATAAMLPEEGEGTEGVAGCAGRSYISPARTRPRVTTCARIMRAHVVLSLIHI